MKKMSLMEMEMENDALIDTYNLDVSAEEAAAEVSCKVVIPEPNQLQLDLDSEEAYDNFKNRLVEFEMHSCYIIEIEEHPSKKGLPHRHVTLTVFDPDGMPHVFGEYERIALQAVLGSDIVRETLNCWRLIRGSENPSRLFEPIDPR